MWQDAGHFPGHSSVRCPPTSQNMPFRSRAEQAVGHLPIWSQPQAASKAVKLHSICWLTKEDCQDLQTPLTFWWIRTVTMFCLCFCVQLSLCQGPVTDWDKWETTLGIPNIQTLSASTFYHLQALATSSKSAAPSVTATQEKVLHCIGFSLVPKTIISSNSFAILEWKLRM